eukprot:CAMPEP_0172372130 /NCGR_PEP_ID=MMETSP1060-20121228/46096_1 /TAXON_ID=37318 /ORGANISM="Pseudo-nitzschia pungens, Strain cf. cingulata" /LENGTH=246 /DNA_ID=CAMNT_0013097977 /DNA_START=261 /DNA_END=998 /DNA_ORIENTATION=+
MTNIDTTGSNTGNLDTGRRWSLFAKKASSFELLAPTDGTATSSGTRNTDSGAFSSSFRRQSYSALSSSRNLDPFSPSIASIDADDGNDRKDNTVGDASTVGSTGWDKEGTKQGFSATALICSILYQIPAIALIGIFHLMVGIPFGVSYFPMYWTSHSGNESSELAGASGRICGDDFHEEGQFPIPGKEAFGIRMFLFSTLVGQVVFAFFSGFKNAIGLQMVENIGFTKELAAIAISHQGYGLEALS